MDRPFVGMLHFNGAGGESVFVEGSWGVVNYYERLPWFWAKFAVESRILFEGQGQ